MTEEEFEEKMEKWITNNLQLDITENKEYDTRGNAYYSIRIELQCKGKEITYVSFTLKD